MTTTTKLIKKLERGESINLEETVDLDMREMHTTEALPIYIRSAKAWKNYTNDALYQTETRLREWFKIKLQDEAWVKNRFNRSYTCSMLVEEIFGRKWNPKIDGKYGQMYSRLFAHYCSKVSKAYWDKKEQRMKSKSAYHLSVSRIKNAPPYSIRMRIEQLEVQGLIPDEYNIKLPKEIKPGYVRSKKARKKYEERREIGKKNYEQRINGSKD